MAIILDGTTGLNTPGVTDTGNLSVSGSTSLATPLPVASGGTGTTSAAFVNLATNVTGTLPVSNGGTGQTSYTDGQLLIGNTTGNTLTKATLTAGTGITITNASGSITITGSSQGPTIGLVRAISINCILC